MESHATGSAAAPADFTPELNAPATKVKLDQGLRAFLVSKDFLDPMDIGLLGADEEAVIETVRRAIRDHEGDKPNFGITEAKNLKSFGPFVKAPFRLRQAHLLMQLWLERLTMRRLFPRVYLKLLKKLGLLSMGFTSQGRGC